jgi:hypothetical protein
MGTKMYIIIKCLEQMLEGLTTCTLKSWCSWNDGVTVLHVCRLAPMSCCISRPNLKAKSKKTLILESVADYDLWLWHSCFNHPGSLNDIMSGIRVHSSKNFLMVFTVDVHFEFGTVFHQVHDEKMCYLLCVCVCVCV